MESAIATLAVSAIAAIIKAVQDASAKTAEEQAKVAAALESAIVLLVDVQAQVTSGMAARDAETLARLNEIAAHPDLPPGLIPTVEAIRAQVAARVAP